MEKKHYGDLLITNKMNAKIPWKIIKGLSNRDRKINVNEIFELNDGSVTAVSKVISNVFN